MKRQQVQEQYHESQGIGNFKEKKDDTQQYPHHHQNRNQETKQSKYQKMMFWVGNSETHDYTAMN